MSHPRGPEQPSGYTPEPPPLYRPEEQARPASDMRPQAEQAPFPRSEHPGVFTVTQWPDPITISALNPPAPDVPFAAEGRVGPRRAVWFLAAAVALLFLIAGVTTSLFLTQRDDYADARREVAAAEDRERQLSETRERLAAVDKTLDDTRRQLVGAQSEGRDLEEQKKIVATCLRLTFDFLNAISVGDEAAKARSQSLLDQMRIPCNQAEPYVR